MKQQTAVEWLVEKITKNHDKDFSSFYKAEIEQAKEMEKEQIMNAFDCGDEMFGTMQGDEYYNETYNNGND
jgi:hypothetical protein